VCPGELISDALRRAVFKDRKPFTASLRDCLGIPPILAHVTPSDKGRLTCAFDLKESLRSVFFLQARWMHAGARCWPSYSRLCQIRNAPHCNSALALLPLASGIVRPCLRGNWRNPRSYRDYDAIDRKGAASEAISRSTSALPVEMSQSSGLAGIRTVMNPKRFYVSQRHNSARLRSEGDELTSRRFVILSECGREFIRRSMGLPPLSLLRRARWAWALAFAMVRRNLMACGMSSDPPNKSKLLSSQSNSKFPSPAGDRYTAQESNTSLTSPITIINCFYLVNCAPLSGTSYPPLEVLPTTRIVSWYVEIFSTTTRVVIFIAVIR
jgi:hypothetical protein